ncbi:FkbM family methyltransferase [Marinirhabdus gelatinilytica]|uniref:FkbM family methyltransferase n=1 Tax=Marinirhabdus gelatinilytica TaxID=1703343 RepID=A0A370Q8W5_9FLAO|nr:FkbM family methyltransferase [Marinirhabdus gelatinilytica]RDK84805.1 FkbM family methyltransferase [Marinirhabdus gelatinilytica]
MKNYKELRIGEKKAFWKENPLLGEIPINIKGIIPFKMYSQNDDSVVKELHWTNYEGWELTSLLLWSDLLMNIPKGIIFDIGAYSGIYSIIASKKAKKCEIHAFDIQDNCINRLKKNMKINEVNNVKIHQAACTDFNGESIFYFYEEEGIMSSIAGLVPNKINDLEKKIRTVKLDDLKVNGSVQLIKIDVEGAELSTLGGLKHILINDSPDVLIEVNNFKDIKKVKNLFPSGYVLYDIDEDSLTIKKMGWFKKPSAHRNYLFTKKDQMTIKEIFSGLVK